MGQIVCDEASIISLVGLRNENLRDLLTKEEAVWTYRLLFAVDYNVVIIILIMYALTSYFCCFNCKEN